MKIAVYDCDLTDAQWNLLQPKLPPAGGRTLLPLPDAPPPLGVGL